MQTWILTGLPLVHGMSTVNHRQGEQIARFDAGIRRVEQQTPRGKAAVRQPLEVKRRNL
jgi:hypothetical protein